MLCTNIWVILAIISSTISEPIIEIGDGKLMGAFSTSSQGNLHSKFLGIPYAQPPIEELRFMSPLPNTPWDGIRNATVHHRYCNQIYTSGFVGEEDCLYLSVYTPFTEFDTAPEPSLPVMVFFHGGAFIFGFENMANGYWMMDHGVILVAVNYRLGPFGFLSLNNSEVSGNQGLRDQQLSLQWVQQNIHHFGGDPNQVTIFGQSAGAWSVTHHLFAPGSKGLFSKAIAQSGSIFGGLTLRAKSTEEAANQGSLFARALGCDFHDLTCLQSKPVLNIMSVPFFPRGCIDGPLTQDPILPTEPEILLETGEFNKVPLIIGHLNAEAIIAVDPALNLMGVPLVLVNSGWFFEGPLLVSETWPWELTLNDIDMAFKVKSYYINSTLGLITENNIGELIQMGTDSMFSYAAYKTAQLWTAYGLPTYSYLFTRVGPYYFEYSSKTAEYHEKYGCGHSDELYYNFDFVGDGYAKFTESDFEFAQTFNILWTNFAKTGNPNGNNTMVNWDLEKLGNYGYLELGSTVEMVEHDSNLQERMEFWDDLGKKRLRDF